MIKQYTINAQGKTVGRLASQIAIILRGKNQPEFLPYKNSNNVVIVTNVSEMRFTGKKIEQKKYYRYSGYPGGLKTMALKDIIKKNPEKILRLAVKNMLPDNKLRKEMLKRLVINK